MKRILVISLVLLAAIAGGAWWWVLRPTRITYLTDGQTIRESAATAALREVLWQAPTPVGHLTDTPSDEFEPRISADGGTLFFVRGKPGHNADIYVATRGPEGWGSLQPFEEVNTSDDELGPEPSADGLLLYFYSDRPGGLGGYDLWVARKTGDGWKPPTNLGAAINTAYNEYGPALSPDGRTLCFSSNRPKPGEARPSNEAWRATVREDLYRHDYDLYAAAITDAGFQAAAPLEVANSPANDGAPAFSPIGDFLYFASDRTGGFGGFDLYRTRKMRGEFQSPGNLGTAVNTKANELDPALDVGGYSLHFSSDRPVTDGAPSESSSTARYHLYRTFSREVFHDVEFRQPVIQWAALWKQIGPNVLWAILALIVFALLLALMRDVHRRRLSLLARCLIVSLMVHALLMLCFNAVKVTATIASTVRRAGPIQVSLSPGGRSGDLSLQIRGGLTHADAPPAAAPKLDRAAPRVSPTISAARMDVPIERTAAPRESSAIQARTVDAMPNPVAAPLRPAALNDVSLASTDYSLPAEPSRSRVPEKSEAAPPPANAMKIGRRFLPPTTQPAVQLQRAELAAENAGDGGHVFDSVAPRGPMNDTPSTSVLPGVMQSNLAAAILGAIPDTNISLPLADDYSRQSGGEGTTISAATISAPPRANVPPIATAGAQNGAIRQLPVESVALPTSQPSFVASLGVGAREGGSDIGKTAPAMSAVAFGLGNVPASGNGGSGIDLALPYAEPGQRISAPETGTGPGGSLVSGATTGASRPGYSLVGGGGSTTIVHLSTEGSQSGSPGGQSLAADGSPFGIGRINAGGDGISDGRMSMGGATGLPSTEIPVTADPSAIAFQLPEETAPPPESAAVQQVPPPAPAVGRIYGRVTDYATGDRLSGAHVQLDLPGGATLSATTDAKGKYEVTVPELPDFFALTASKPGYLPKSRNVANRVVAGRSTRLNFTLRPQSLQVVPLEEFPVVHHLGNDAFVGQINSQFQRESEGRHYLGEFQLSANQLHDGPAALELLAKGVQCPHRIRINGQYLDVSLDESPEDGSFGFFVAAFDAALLQEGSNTLEIRGSACSGDLDDFEFVNPQIRLQGQPD